MAYTLKEINQILHLSEYVIWLRKNLRRFVNDWLLVKRTSDNSYEFGYYSEKFLIDTLLIFYRENYPNMFCVSHTNEKAKEKALYDALADSTMGDISITTALREIFNIDLKSTNSWPYGSITWPSPINFGSDNLSEENRQRLLTEYGYSHNKALPNHIYLLTNTNFEKPVIVRATAVFEHWNEIKRYVNKTEPLATFLDNKKGYETVEEMKKGGDKKAFPGIRSTLEENVDWIYL